MMEIQRKELEKRELTFTRERERFIQELEEKTKELTQKEISLKETMEGGFEEKLAACVEDARCQAEDVVKEEYEKRMLDMEKEYKKKLIIYKKKLIQYKKQLESGAASPAGAPTPLGRAPPDTFPCLNCKSTIIIPTKQRPITVRCANCSKEYTLRAPKAKAAPPPAAPSARAATNELPGLDDDPDEDRTEVTPPPSPGLGEGGSGMKVIACPHCGREHEVASNLTKKILCSCGRRIRTK